MKKKQYIAFLLFSISLMMLMIPVMPHHHHADGLICMKNDLTADCCGHSHDADANHEQHCCCNTCCATTHFLQQTPGSDQTNVQPDVTYILIPFFESIVKLSLLPEPDVQRHECIYVESLHGTSLRRATGLRAPPSLLA